MPSPRRRYINEMLLPADTLALERGEKREVATAINFSPMSTHFPEVPYEVHPFPESRDLEVLHAQRPGIEIENIAFQRFNPQPQMISRYDE